MTPNINIFRGPRRNARRPFSYQFEALEVRCLPAVDPLTLANPAIFGESGAGPSSGASITADGQLVVFRSDAPNLVPNDLNNTSDIFLYNRSTGSVSLISVNLAGTASGNFNSFDPKISADGRYVLFSSEATDLTAEPIIVGGGHPDIFVRDLQTNTTILVSKSLTNTGGNVGSSNPILSNDGSFVVFQSFASNLVANDTNDRQDIFVRNLQTGVTTLVSHNADNSSGGNGHSHSAQISGNNRFIVFVSSATNLGPIDIQVTNQDDVYVYDTVSGDIELISIDDTGLNQSNGSSGLGFGNAISADGRYVVFQSNAGNLQPGVTDVFGSTDVFIRDRQLGTTRHVSINSTGTTAGSGSNGSITPDGRYVAFVSGGDLGLTVSDQNGAPDVFVRDLQTSTTRIVSVNAAGTSTGNGFSGTGAIEQFASQQVFISPDGRYVAFGSEASDLAVGISDTNTGGPFGAFRRDVFIRDMQANVTEVISVDRTGTATGSSGAYVPALSGDFSVVAFQSDAGNLVDGDHNGLLDVFVRDRTANTTALASPHSPLFPDARLTNAGGSVFSVTPDGRYVGFTSDASNPFGISDLTPGIFTTFGWTNSYVRDTLTGEIQVVSVIPDGTSTSGGNSVAPLLSNDGRFVAFVSSSTILAAGVTDSNNRGDVYVRDLQAGITRMISVAPGGTQSSDGDSGAGGFAFSQDGRYVAFTSDASNLVAGFVDGNGTAFGAHDVYIHDLHSGTTRLLSHLPGSPLTSGNGSSFSPIFSTDGGQVIFQSRATDLDAGVADANGQIDIFAYDVATGDIQLISVNSVGNAAGNGEASTPVVSADGRYVAFASTAADLVAGDTNGAIFDVFVRDLQTQTTQLVSADVTNTDAGNGHSFSPSISADGRRILFVSNSSNLATNDPAGQFDVFLRDLDAQTTTLVSVNAAGTAGGNDRSGSTTGFDFPTLSPNGRYAAFLSLASDLVPGFVDGNGSRPDLYLRDLQTGTTVLVSYNHTGTASSQSGNFPTFLVTDDGQLFFSYSASQSATSDDMFNGDRNNATDSFVFTFEGAGRISGTLFNDADRDGGQDGGESGIRYWTVFIDENGNGAYDFGEPNVQTDASGNYAFNNLAAGTYTVGLVLQDGFTRTAPTVNTFSVTLETDSSVVTDRDFGVAAARIDLRAENITAPISAAAGRDVDISWAVRNLGTEAANGTWQDAVYLSLDDVLDASDTLVAVVPHADGLAANGTYTANATIHAPAQLEGTFHVLVLTDRRNQQPLDTHRANNDAASSTIDLDLPVLIVGTPLPDEFTAPNQELYYQFTVQPGQSLILSLLSAAPEGATELYVRRNALPSQWDFDFSSREPGTPDQSLTVPLTQPGTYYVLARSQSGAAATSPFTLTAVLPGFTIQNVSTNQGGNTGRVTVRIDGTGMSPQTRVAIVSGSTVIDAIEIDFRDPSLLFATFDLQGRELGDYDVRITDGSQTNTAPDAFDVVPGTEGGLSVDIRMIGPEAARFSGPQPSSGGGGGGAALGNIANLPRILIEYTNNGNTDILTPIMQLETDFGSLVIEKHEIVDENDNIVQFLGTSIDGPAGVLRPGATGRVTVLFIPPVLPASGGGPSSARIVLQSEVKGPTINWIERQAQTRPDFIQEDAWDAIFGNFVATVGNSAEQYRAVLADNASYLSRFGDNVTDINRLIGFEIQQANAALPLPVLSSAIDAGVPTSGLDLAFGRAFLQPISGRYRLGVLGRGWASSWEQSATTTPNGDVRIESGGNYGFFSKLTDGTYRGPEGENGVLTLTNGVYRLRELDGTIRAFRADGKLDYVEDTHATRVTADYDVSGLLVTLTHSSGRQLTLSYNAQGRISQISDQAGRTTTYSYDAGGEHLLSVTDNRGTTAYTYVTGEGAAREHALASITLPDGTHRFFSYDARGRLSRIEKDVGAEALSFDYDSAGAVTVTDADGAATQFFFDDGGQLQQVRDALGRVSNFDYDENHNLELFVSPTGLTWSYDHDALGNVTRTVDPLGHEVTYAFDTEFNRLSSVTDARGNTTSYDYDSIGDLRSITYPNGSQEHLSYDPLGNLAESINRRGQAIGYVYDSHGMLTRKDLSDGSHVDYTYDARGNLLTATDSAGTIDLDYDNADRLIKISYPNGQFLQFDYDAGGRRIQSVDQDGFTLNYEYNAAGRLSRLTDGAAALVVEYTYDLVGRLSRKDLGNGTFTTYDYDAANQLLEIVDHAPTGAVNSSFEYSYDDEGLRTGMTTLEGHTSYEYDAIGQLTKVILPSGRTIEYTYDAVGNRITVVDNGVTTSYVTNELNQYVQVGGTSYIYDADGNLVSRTDSTGTTAFTFDDENRLTGSTGPAGTWSYVYDPLGQRSASVRNGSRTDYLIDPAGLSSVVAEYGAGGLLAHYIYGLGLVSQIDVGGNSTYYDFDAVGNTVGMTNSSGAYVNRYSYLPFGETTVIGAAISNAFTFGGAFGVMDAGAGVDFMRARYYDASVGQFISNDPIGLLGGDLTLRGYVGNNPVQYVDPSGLAGFDGETLFVEASEDLFRRIEDFQEILDSPWLVEEGSSSSMLDGAADFPGLLGLHEGDGNPKWQWIEKLRQYRDAQRASALSKYMNSLKNFAAGAGNFGLKGLGALGPIGNILDTISIAKDIPEAYRLARELGANGLTFHPENLGRFFNALIINLAKAVDPNDITGPGGFGTQHFVAGEQTMPYSIQFENSAQSGATAPALEATVTHQLDADLNWSSFTLDDFGFGSIGVDVPDGVQSYQTRVNYHNQDGTPLFVDVSAALDLQSGIVTWSFLSVDPATGVVPFGVTEGFLPVNDETGRGEGFVRYAVRSKSSLATGTTIDQQASIVFDFNDPILTNIFTNTIDNGRPSSSVQVLPVQSDESFTLTWGGTDDPDGSGVASYDILVSDNGAPFVIYLDNTTDTSTQFTGVVGHTYRFYSIATDNVGHSEIAPGGADAQTTVLGPNDSPELLDALFSLVENASAGQLLGTLTGTDPNPADSLSYSILNGNLDNAFAINPATGALTIANAAAIDFETHPIFSLTVQVEDDRGATDTAIVTVNLTDANDIPQIIMGSAIPTFVKKNKAPVSILPNVVVKDADQSLAFRLGGGTLLLTVNAVGGKKKLLDQFNLPSPASLGTTTGPQVNNGILTLQINLNASTTAADVQAYLRAVTFSTKGKGLKIPTRNVGLTLTDAAGASVTGNGSIQVKKKP